MRMTKARFLAVAAAVTVTGTPALAEPVVVTDIPPVHSLVARVMQGIGEPTLILPPGASPHGYAMRPSEAAALSDADVVFWVGPELTPWLDRAIDTLGTNAKAVELLEAPGTVHLEFREGATFEAHHHGDEEHDGHGHDEAGHDDHDHDDHGDGAHEHAEHDHDHDHEDHAAHEDHDEHEGHDHAEHDHDGDEDHAAHDDHEGHDHDEHEGHGHDEHADAHGHDHHGVDPHAWLDPENGKVWLTAIAETLAQADPDNADAYRANAADASGELDALTDTISGTLEPVRGKPFIVFHDAYHYFENRFDIEAAGAVSLSDASKPGPARVKEIRDTIVSLGAACVFAEPQFPPALITTLIEGTDAREATLDPLGTEIEPGPALYPALLTDLAANLSDCLD